MQCIILCNVKRLLHFETLSETSIFLFSSHKNFLFHMKSPLTLCTTSEEKVIKILSLKPWFCQHIEKIYKCTVTKLNANGTLKLSEINDPIRNY